MFYQKRIIRGILSLVLALFLAIALLPVINVYAATDNIRVTIDGQEVTFPGGQGPIIVNNRVLVPVRGVFEMLGFEVAWDRETRTAIMTSEEYEIHIPIGSTTFTTNGRSHPLDVPAQVINGRTMVPIRFPLASVGLETNWVGSARTVEITAMDELLFSTSPMGQWAGISIEGSPDFIRSTNEAINLIRTEAPDFYETVLHHVSIIRPNTYGPWAWRWRLHPPGLLIDMEVYTASTIWYASAIINDAIYLSMLYENPTTFDEGNEMGLIAFIEILNYQLQFLQLVNAPAQYIALVEDQINNPVWLLDEVARPTGSRMGQWNEITIIGDANFTLRTYDAINLIRTSAPELYTEILHYLGIIRQHSFSGMWYWLDPPEFRVGTASYTGSVIWYASIIIHDAIHSRQAYANPETFLDQQSQLWFDAEMEALDYQIKFFVLIGAPQHYITHIESIRDNPWWLRQVTW
ncbi:MAG: copper amine oxidase N-terminal domain-containing protein [Defluviitaleaceae bacterium]|nr:copper amine oxidase N-terminal domain-containing protein [Defluviitaleaceae bacterium]